MRRFILVFLCVFAGSLFLQRSFAADLSSCAQSMSLIKRDLDPVALYGTDRLQFDIYRKDKKIGAHTVAFDQRGRTLNVNIETRIKVGVLFVPVYSYLYTSSETWCDGQLITVDAYSDENGKKTALSAMRRGDDLTVSPIGKVLSFDSDVFVSNHWNAGVLGGNEIFNTVTGKRNEISITSLGTDWVSVGDERRLANHYRFNGQLEVEVWYDGGGRWVKLRFQDKKGTPIELRCVDCGGATTAAMSDTDTAQASNPS